jgi:hypothetical protein
VAARSKAWVCGRSLAGIVGSNPTGGVDLSLVSVVCYQVEVFATGWSLIQGSPTECGVSECDRQASIMRMPWTNRGCYPMENITLNSSTPATCPAHRNLLEFTRLTSLGTLYKARRSSSFDVLNCSLYSYIKLTQTAISPITLSSDTCNFCFVVNLLNTRTNLNYVYIFNSHRALNTFRLDYKKEID